MLGIVLGVGDRAGTAQTSPCCMHFIGERGDSENRAVRFSLEGDRCYEKTKTLFIEPETENKEIGVSDRYSGLKGGKFQAHLPPPLPRGPSIPFLLKGCQALGEGSM